MGGDHHLPLAFVSERRDGDRLAAIETEPRKAVVEFAGEATGHCLLSFGQNVDHEIAGQGYHRRHRCIVRDTNQNQRRLETERRERTYCHAVVAALIACRDHSYACRKPAQHTAKEIRIDGHVV